MSASLIEEKEEEEKDRTEKSSLAATVRVKSAKSLAPCALLLAAGYLLYVARAQSKSERLLELKDPWPWLHGQGELLLVRLNGSVVPAGEDATKGASGWRTVSLARRQPVHQEFGSGLDSLSCLFFHGLALRMSPRTMTP